MIKYHPDICYRSIISSCFYYREQSSTLWVFVFLNPVEKKMWKFWCWTVSDFKISFLWTKPSVIPIHFLVYPLF